MTTEIGAPGRGAPTPTSATDRRKLDLSLAFGIIWTGGLKWFTQIFSWAATLIIARILTPEDYGLFGIATLYIGFVQLINEFGLGAAIIRRRDLTEDQISALGGLSLLLDLGLWAVSLVLAYPIASFFGEPEVRWIISALGVTFMTTGLQILPRSLLSRDLQFRKVATLDAVEALATTVSVLVFAFLGYRYWSLVLGTIIGGCVSTVMALRWRFHRLARPKGLRGISQAVYFGGHLVVSRVAWYAYSNADFAVVGRVLGTAALGAYSFGWSLATIPVLRISALVGQVIPSVLSAVQNDRQALRRYLLIVTEALAFITFPFSAGLALVADDLVLVALGDKWHAAILPLRLLACYAGLRSITSVLPHVQVAIGHSKNVMHYSLLALALMPPLFMVGSHWGTAGVAWAWLVGYPLITIPTFRDVMKVTGFEFSSYREAIWPALKGTAVMTAAVFGARLLAPDTWPRAFSLSVDVGVGALAYATMLYGGYGARVKEIWALLRDRRQ